MDDNSCTPSHKRQYSAVTATLRWLLFGSDMQAKIAARREKKVTDLVVGRTRADSMRLKRNLMRLEKEMKQIKLLHYSVAEKRRSLDGGIFLVDEKTEKWKERVDSTRELEAKLKQLENRANQRTDALLKGIDGAMKRIHKLKSKKKLEVKGHKRSKSLEKSPKSKRREEGSTQQRQLVKKLEEYKKRFEDSRKRAMNAEEALMENKAKQVRVAGKYLEREEAHLKARNLLKAKLLNSKLEAADKENSLKQEIEVMKQEMENEKKRLMNVVNDLREQHQTADGLNASQSEQLEALEKRVQELDEENSKLSKKLIETEEANQRQKEEMEKVKIKSIQLAKEGALQKCGKLEEQAKKLMDTYQKASAERDRALRDLKESRKNFKLQMNSLSEELQVAKQQLQQQYERIAPLQHSLLEAQTAKSYLEKQLEKVTKTLECKNADVSVMQSRIEQLEVDLEVVASEQTHQKDIDTEKMQKLSSQITELLQQKTKATSQLRDIKGKYEATNDQLQSVKNELKVVQADRDTLQTAVTKLKSAFLKLRMAQKSKTSPIGKENDKPAARRKKISAMRDAEKEWKSAAQKKIKVIEKKHSDDVDLLKRQHSREVGALQEKIIEFESFLNKEYGGNLVALEKELAKVKLRTAELEAENDDYQEIIENLHDQVKQQQQKIEQNNKASTWKKFFN
mmetsp:Transcript_19999/g.29952  ORF Transcript_19999/g.29952 Transcript_19999/m.29952 type:complete len:682 (+) Transcript_19999:86-2131(+)|eukprot:CAMPEP_0167743042 /NCGR_PEP_ID=MMETSP0110_2-20121227/1788_1 /TAXON_ID=629695 /ORGANISM="Gymnochlora sp., Strain CCMP2014" /LENGTH=681 /DNA_ID=CAMNT_0007627353 /DNA_START=20 /DNA_END=2065 /DNA_ORIENTATION=-